MITEDPLTYSFPVAIDGDPLISNVRRAASLDDADLFSVSVGDRYRHAVLAAQWLAKISSDREKFGFYELGPHQQQLAGLLYRPGLEKVPVRFLRILERLCLNASWPTSPARVRWLPRSDVSLPIHCRVRLNVGRHC